MTISRICILSVSDTVSGCSMFKCRFHPAGPGLDCFLADLTLSHLEGYHGTGVPIVYRFSVRGLFSEMPFRPEGCSGKGKF